MTVFDGVMHGRLAKSFFTPRNTVTAEGGMQEKAVRRRRR
jgi:hypothetical protein